MKVDPPILYYSVNTRIAYFINENFYRKHFVWCSPVFDAEKLDTLNAYRKIPPSSNPQSIYNRFLQDVRGGDNHSSYIAQNKVGLKRGATAMLKDGSISNTDFARINKIIDGAGIDEFTPLKYVIPAHFVQNRIVFVDVDCAANPLSLEFQIVDLKRHEFDVMH